MDFKYIEEHGMIDPSYANKMKERKCFFTAQPVVADDDGHLGYLWQGIAYIERSKATVDFQPFIKTNMLFYTPDDAKEEAKLQFVSYEW